MSQTGPLIKTAKTAPLIKTAKTLDLTVSSRQANFANAIKLNQSKEVKEMVSQMTKKVTNKAIQIGKRNYVVDESEEIKLKFDVSIFVKCCCIFLKSWVQRLPPNRYAFLLGKYSHGVKLHIKYIHP